MDYRAEGKIKHCRIKVEGRLYLIGNAQFESLVDLVSYYERTPLYKKMHLRHPVNQYRVEQLNMVSGVWRSASGSSVVLVEGFATVRI